MLRRVLDNSWWTIFNAPDLKRQQHALMKVNRTLHSWQENILKWGIMYRHV
jgi:hypothetical protein